MKKFLYNYQTIIHFTEPVTRHFFRLRCVPCVNACQQLVKHDLLVHPAGEVRHDTDAWGNPMQYGSQMEPHDAFVYVSSGVAALEPYCITEAAAADVFRVQSPLTAISPAMKEFLSSNIGGGTAIERATTLSHRLHQHLNYVTGSTTAGTTAAEAFEQRQGVCQDYAHILIALCRWAGIAARYVCGFIPGVGQTHAWVEVHDGLAWLGIDPTNDLVIDQQGYIKIAHGRDAADCPVNRGVFTGQAAQQVEIRVIVEEI